MILAEVPGWMSTTAGNPGGAAPAGRPRPPPRARRGQHRPFPGFSATATTDQGRVGSFDHPHPTQTEANPAVTGHMRNEGTENWQTTRSGDRPHGQRLPPDGAATLSTRVGPRVPHSRERVPHLAAVRSAVEAGARRSLLLHPGWPTAADSGAHDLHLALGWAGRPVPAPVPDAWSAQVKSHPPASGCGWSNERTRPWSVVAVAGKTGKDGAVRAWLAGVAGVCPRVPHRRGSRLWSSSSPGTSARITWNYSSRRRVR
jgi:hypothetical protein